MSVEVDANELSRAMGDLSKDMARDAIDVWFTESQRILSEADSEEDDSNLFPILQSATPPVWDAALGAWRFSYTHLATIFHEFGAEPHIIRARRAEYLAFEWPDAPQWVRQAFSATFPLVFFKEVNHPGVPERRFVRGGREDAIDFLRAATQSEAFGGVFN